MIRTLSYYKTELISLIPMCILGKNTIHSSRYCTASTTKLYRALVQFLPGVFTTNKNALTDQTTGRTSIQAAHISTKAPPCANSLSPRFSENRIRKVLIYITVCLFNEKWNHKSARQYEQCISRVTINRARAKFPRELYLRRRLKLFRNAFAFIQCRERHLQLIRATRSRRARGRSPSIAN